MSRERSMPTGFHISVPVVPAPHNLRALDEALGLPADMPEPETATAPREGSFFFRPDDSQGQSPQGTDQGAGTAGASNSASGQEAK